MSHRPQKRKADDSASNAKKAKTEEAAGDEEQASVWIGGLPWAATQEELLELLNSLDAGEIASVFIATDRESGRSKGFGYAYCSQSTATALVKHSGVELGGRQLKFDVGTKKVEKGDRPQSAGGASAPGPSLIVRNLPYDIDRDTLQQYFEGSIGARIITNPEDGTPKGFVALFTHRCPVSHFFQFRFRRLWHS